VIYTDSEGGYINNVPGTFSRQPSDYSIQYYYGGAVPSGPHSVTSINNNSLVGNGINTVDYQGIRVGLAYKINDQWDALLTQSYQDMKSNGVFYEMPHTSSVLPSLQQPLPDLSVQTFVPSWNHDSFENTALTVNGRVGDLKLVYTGGYLVRNVEQQQDYTGYARGANAAYYQCMPYGVPAAQASCGTPAGYWRDTVRNTHDSQELRASTPDDWRLRGIAGIFWEEFQTREQVDWSYKSAPGFTAVGPPAGTDVVNPDLRADNVAFFDDITRGFRQKAAFGSVDFDIIPKVLTVTGGTRYYDFDNTEVGAVTGSFGCYEAGPGPCLASATNIDAENLHTKYKGFKSRANLTWHILPDVLVYYTWSQGFRPGAFNRSFACYIADAKGVPQYCSPLSFTSDNLTNNEIGWKTEFFDRRLQWNGAVYREDWNNVQVNFFDPGVLGNVGFGANGPNYQVKGVETSLIAVLAQGLTAQGGASWNSSKQTNSPFLIANNPALLTDPATKAEYGQPILSVQNPYGPVGSPAANAPPIQFNLRLRYEWTVNSFNAFAQAGVTHTGHSFTQSGSNPPLSANGNVSTTQLRFEDPAYSEYDAAIGIAKDAWSAQLYAENLTNVIASVFTSSTQFVPAETITRPRVLGVKFGYRF